MTAQVNDLFLYQDKEYQVAGISEGEAFDITELGLNPVGTCSACWRGYQAVFSIADSSLVIESLATELYHAGGYMRLEGPTINKIKPQLCIPVKTARCSGNKLPGVPEINCQVFRK